ncbi:MAG: hypothetical protein Q4A32_00830 [Lachnospiraceae bacterium]|nr:hypothetical protein [Lachnospiraceae bacterium]
MYKADVWVWVDSKGWKESPKRYHYSVEGEFKGKALRSFGCTQDENGEEVAVSATWDRITLMGIAEALERFRQNAEVTIHCENYGVLSSIEHDLERWKGNGFIGSTKKEIKNVDLWRRVAAKSNMLKLVTDHVGFDRVDELRNHVFAKEKEEYESKRGG